VAGKRWAFEGLLCEMVAREFAATGYYGPLVAALREQQKFEKHRALANPDRREAALARRNAGYLAAFMRAAGVEKDRLLSVTLRAEVVPLVRRGLLSDLGDAAEAIHDSIGRAGYDRAAGWYAKPLRRLDAARALLDRIGWEPPDRQKAVTLCLDGPSHRATLVRGVGKELDHVVGRTEDPDVSDATRARAEANRVQLEKLLAAIGDEEPPLAPGSAG
jgi:hypothetical protein